MDSKSTNARFIGIPGVGLADVSLAGLTEMNEQITRFCGAGMFEGVPVIVSPNLRGSQFIVCVSQEIYDAMKIKPREHTIILVCDDQLASCTVCKGGEGSLTTECCGRPITEDETFKIYNLGTLDFIGGKWVAK